MKRTLLWSLAFSPLFLCQAQLPLLQTENTYFVRSDTRQKVILKGFDISNNSWGFYEWPISDSLQKAGLDPLIRPTEQKPFLFTSDDVERNAQLNHNVVRYCFNDGLFRADNPKRQANLDLMKNHIAQLAAIGKYSFVTMQINPGLDVQNDNYERTKSPSVRLKSPFESDSVFHLWVETWQFVAQGLKDVDAVAGYEVINEPRRPALADASEEELVSTYLSLMDSIRLVDKRHIVLVPEFNSREANPGESYWSDAQGQMVVDKGEQGIIWERNWLALPDTLSNFAYVAHIYSPFEFTTGKTAATFDAASLQSTVQETVNWVYAHHKPLYISEYGVNYFQNLSGNDAKRIEWLKTIHDAFDASHVNTTIWQYKDLITPWVDLEGTFALWLQYYDTTTIKSVANGKVEYVDDATKQAAVSSKIDQALNQYFIENGKFKTFSMVNNESLKEELNRYFASTPLGLFTPASSTSSNQTLYIDKDVLFFEGLPPSLAQMRTRLIALDGKELVDTILPIRNGKAQLSLSGINKVDNKLLLAHYGSNGEWAKKVVWP